VSRITWPSRKRALWFGAGVAVLPLACASLGGLTGGGGDASDDATRRHVDAHPPAGDAAPDAALDGGSRESGTTVDSAATHDAAEDGPLSCDVQGSGVVAAVGCPCTHGLACAGNAQRNVLACVAGKWVSATACDPGSNCDTGGQSPGKCAAIVSQCADATPGTVVCDTQYKVGKCSPDLVTVAGVQSCPGEDMCMHGACKCVAGAFKCVGTSARSTCDDSGAWVDAESCHIVGTKCSDGGCPTF
jgi:hypothetical protein